MGAEGRYAYPWRGMGVLALVSIGAQSIPALYPVGPTFFSLLLTRLGPWEALILTRGGKVKSSGCAVERSTCEIALQRDPSRLDISPR